MSAITNCIHCAQTTNMNLRLCNTCLKDDTVTITCSQARKVYKLTNEDLIGLTVTKSRYYIKDITDNLEEIQRKQKAAIAEKKLKEELEKKSKMSYVRNYLLKGDVEYSDFVINGCQDVLKRYYKGGLIEKIEDVLTARYNEYQENILAKQNRREELLNVIEKHEMKNFLVYKDKLKYRIESYVNDDTLSLVGYFLIIQEEYNRTKELYDKFNALGFEPRLDSYLCQQYINYGLEGVKGSTNDMGKIESVDDIVDVMYCMNFLYSKTSYKNKLDYVHSHKYEYRSHYEDLATVAKRLALSEWIKKGNSISVPKRLLPYAN
jgi:hypothetical protein